MLVVLYFAVVLASLAAISSVSGAQEIADSIETDAGSKEIDADSKEIDAGSKETDAQKSLQQSRRIGCCQ